MSNTYFLKRKLEKALKNGKKIRLDVLAAPASFVKHLASRKDIKIINEGTLTMIERK